jgi:hypothetical protein
MIGLVSSTDPFAWFADDGNTTVLPASVARRRRINDGGRSMR